MPSVDAPDVVYVVRPGNVNEELRFSLRSLANLPHGRVWIAGYCPPWVHSDVERIPVPKKATKYQSSTANLRAACEHPEVAEDCLLFNDDFFVMQQLGVMPMLHRGPVERVEAYYASRARGQYLRGLRETKAWLGEMGHRKVVSYEIHTPLPFKKSLMLETLDAGAHLPVLHKRTAYGTLNQIGGRHISDPKILTRGPRFPKEAPFLSTMTDTFTRGQVGAYIRGKFPKPGPYETTLGRR